MNENLDQQTEAQQPAGQTVPPNAVKPTQSVVKKPKKIAGIVAIAVGALLLVSAGATVMVYSYINNKPEKVLADAFSNTVSDTLEGKPATSIGSLTFESKGAQPGKITVEFNSKTNNANTSSAASAKVVYGGKTYNLKASTAVFGDSEYYFKIENLKNTVASISGAQPNIGAYAKQLEPLLTNLDNKWVRVTKEDLKQLSGSSEQNLDLCAESLKNLTMSKRDKQQLKKLFTENQFIVASETLKPETINGEKSYHFKLDFNNAAAENFAKQVIAMESLKPVKSACNIDEKKLEQSVRQGKDKAGTKDTVKPVVELWVAKANRRPTKFRLGANDKDITLDFNTQIKLGAKGVEIQKPTSFVTVNELKAEFEKLSTTTMQTTTTNL